MCKAKGNGGVGVDSCEDCCSNNHPQALAFETSAEGDCVCAACPSDCTQFCAQHKTDPTLVPDDGTTCATCAGSHPECTMKAAAACDANADCRASKACEASCPG
jgi:hypothetical protein